METLVFSAQAEAVLARIDAELATLDEDGVDRSAEQAEMAFANAVHIAEANLRHFMPGHDARTARELVREVLFHQRMSALDQNDFDLLGLTSIHSHCGDLPWSKGTPRIFCTYHLGSYKFLFHVLSAQGVDCLLFVSGRTLAAQGQDFLESAARARVERGWTGALTIIDAEAPNSVLHGLRALRRGTPLVLYADGNAGAGQGEEHLRHVSFFGRTLAVRSGIAYLSHAAAAPIVPATCLRRADGRLDLVFHEAITPGVSSVQGRSAYIDASMQQIHDQLAAVLRPAPAQWEGWLHVHRALVNTSFDGVACAPLDADEAARRLQDRDRYAMLRYPGLHLLLDKDAFTCTVMQHRRAGSSPPERSRSL